MRQRGGAERAKTVRMFFWKRGVLAAAMAALILSGCSEYESSEELRAQAGTEAQADGEVQAAAEVRTSKQTETGADISGRSQSRTWAAVPEFETVSDRVYVNTECGAIAENGRQVLLDPNWDYAEFAKITSGTAVLYQSQTAERKNLTICVTAGHGTKGGVSVKTKCHPDGSPKRLW